MSDDSELATVITGMLIGGVLAGGPIGGIAVLVGHGLGKLIVSARKKSSPSSVSRPEKDSSPYSWKHTPILWDSLLLPKTDVLSSITENQNHIFDNHQPNWSQNLISRDEYHIPTPTIPPEPFVPPINVSRNEHYIPTPTINYELPNPPVRPYQRERTRPSIPASQKLRGFRVNEFGEIFKK